MIVRLTEAIHYRSPVLKFGETNYSCITIFPGLIERNYLKGEIGPEMYERGLRLGVVIEDPS